MRAAARAAFALVALTSAAGATTPPPDPIAAELARWAEYIRTNTATDELWTQIKPGAETVLGRAEQALKQGHRLLALQRLAFVNENLSATTYIGQRTAEQRKDQAAFEAEWKRMGGELKPQRAAADAKALEELKPAAVRAMAEAALPQVKIYYDASLDYGRSTTPDSGLYYLGAAQAQRQFAAFARTLHEPEKGAPPPLRALAPELDDLQDALLAAYRPPASLDKHRDFIGANAALKEARELDAAGLRYGALLRYLEAARRFAPLKPGPAATPTPAAVAEQLEPLAARLDAPGTDHSIGRLMLQVAQFDLAEHAQDGNVAVAAAVANDVLPRYFAALQAAPARAARPAPTVTVTLVRWPYT
jgi:hypothetical protein